MAVSKKRNKSKGGFQLAPKNSNTYIKENARKLDLYETLMYANLFEEGIGYVIVSRKKKNGEIVAGFFLVDVFCLGIKDSFASIMTLEEYDEHKQHLVDSDESYYITKSPNYIYNLLYGAADYAEELGFKPEKDFAISEYILAAVDSIEYEDIPFGSDGRPFYIEGPNDKAASILSTLRKHKAEEDFDFVLLAGSDEEE
jgi:hypothetical protein